MLYPAYVEIGNDTTAYSVVLPDFPGCFSAADNEADLAKNVQEAVELHFDGEELVLPEPTSLSELRNHPDYDYDGVWMMFDINTDKLSTKAKRFNATLPENLLNDIDNYVAKHGGSRSGFLADASRDKLQQ